MPQSVLDRDVTSALEAFRMDAGRKSSRTATVDGKKRSIPYPFPSPEDWRDSWIYFVLTDRFNNPDAPPRSTWNRKFGFRQGGTFNGIRAQLPYIRDLGATALWLSPVLKNSKPDTWEYNYPGYSTQDFLGVDERFASDGKTKTAERELTALVNEAHALGIHVILDIVLNHAARVFDYDVNGNIQAAYKDAALMAAPLGQEQPIVWLDGTGAPRWATDIPDDARLTPDDAVWPRDLQRKEFFRRRGDKLDDNPGTQPEAFVRGDFGSMRQLTVEYDAQPASERAWRELYGKSPVLSILIRAYEYAIARYDFDGFRIDTVKYVHPAAVETFGNAIREFALSGGKRNFFTFGEVWEDGDSSDRNEAIIANFVGRNSSSSEGFGIDAALDFPVFNRLRSIVKGNRGVEALRQVYEARKGAEKELLSTHGEAGRFFVTFLDNHDQHERFFHPDTPEQQVTMGLTLLFTLQGIPCVYYGTEQGLTGTVDEQGRPTLDSFESVREALWGKSNPFKRSHRLWAAIRKLAALRAGEAALRYGRLYFRQVSGNGQDFGMPSGAGGVLAYSRVLSEREVVIVANTSTNRSFSGSVVCDLDIGRSTAAMTVAYGNQGVTGSRPLRIVEDAKFYEGAMLCGSGVTAAVDVSLRPMEVQVLVPAQ